MANKVWHVELQIEFDPADDNLNPGLWDRLYAQDRLYASKRVPVSARGLQCAGICRDQGVIAWMYLRQRSNGRREAVHEHAEDAARHPAPESDEHKAYKERIVSVAETAGHRADTEVRAPGRRIITDALVEGSDGLRIGWEVQLSTIGTAGPKSVRARAAKAQAIGITPAWHTDRRDFDGRNDTHWTRTDRHPPEVILKSPLLVWTGVRRLLWERCDDRRSEPCPDRRTGRCGKRHPRPELNPIQFDDLVRGTAAGELVPIEFKLSTRINRFWVPAADRDRYLDATGRFDEDEEDTEQRSHASPAGPTCRPRPTPTTCECGRKIHLFDAQGTPRCWRCKTGYTDHQRPQIEISRPPVLLDWNGRSHVAQVPAPCRICRKPAYLLDDDGRHAHKVCVEGEL